MIDDSTGNNNTIHMMLVDNNNDIICDVNHRNDGKLILRDSIGRSVCFVVDLSPNKLVTLIITWQRYWAKQQL